MKLLKLFTFKIERFLRNELVLHFLLMYFIIKNLMILSNLCFPEIYKESYYFIIGMLLLITIMLSLAKELYDLKIKKMFIDILDIITSILGGIIAITL